MLFPIEQQEESKTDSPSRRFSERINRFRMYYARHTRQVPRLTSTGPWCCAYHQFYHDRRNMDMTTLRNWPPMPPPSASPRKPPITRSKTSASSHGALVAPGLVIGDAVLASSKPLLDAFGITAVVNCAEEIDSFTCPVAGTASSYLRLDMKDHAKFRIQDAINQAVPFIRQHLEKKKKKGTAAPAATVLVHCQMGISRSATIVMAYLMHKHGLTYDDALRLVQRKRPIVQPNPGFEAQLRTRNGK